MFQTVFWKFHNEGRTFCMQLSTFKHLSDLFLASRFFPSVQGSNFQMCGVPGVMLLGPNDVFSICVKCHSAGSQRLCVNVIQHLSPWSRLGSKHIDSLDFLCFSQPLVFIYLYSIAFSKQRKTNRGNIDKKDAVYRGEIYLNTGELDLMYQKCFFPPKTGPAGWSRSIQYTSCRQTWILNQNQIQRALEGGLL